MRHPERYARFLLAYRLETSDNPGADAPGRGWVVRVPEADEPALADPPAARWFSELAEVGGVIRALLDDRRPAAAGNRRTRR